ncbi:hypothetical protein V498_09954, partial [Pseudogymnoascus sp. VKM F-4517 (FW-2822)]
MKFYVTATVITLAVGAMSVTVPDVNKEAISTTTVTAPAGATATPDAECRPLL